MGLQAPRAAIMIRPHHFHPNPETLADNGFQNAGGKADPARALAEFDAAVAALREAGVEIHVFEDETPGTPDSVFPNNWFSTHPGGHVAVYPMFPPNRRRERRADVIEFLKRHYRVQEVVDYSGLEMDNLSLEGTGAMVLDHRGHIAYVARSNRADPVILERFCTHFRFEPIAFDATDPGGQRIYHTNVLMSVNTAFALIGLGCITDPARRAEVAERLEETGHEVIDLSYDQIAAFAGNAMELTGREGRILALSQTALDALRPEQIRRIEHTARLLPLAVPTLEMAGGSVRCMIAGIHLSKRKGERSD